ncbi:MAG: hypothetical protein MZV70_30230 [Desulfobacterales bacterium]|nr:hypothetical protein [Desulfobacterales bacterium]
MLNGLISIWRPGTAIGWLSNYAMIGMTIIAVSVRAWFWNGYFSGRFTRHPGRIGGGIKDRRSEWSSGISCHITFPLMYAGDILPIESWG